MYNMHTHVFTLNHIPDDYMPGFNISWFKNSEFTNCVSWFLSNLNPFSDKDMLDHAEAWLNNGNKETQLEVFRELINFYPDDTKFVLLPMDFRGTGCNDYSKEKFKEQLIGLSNIKDIYPDRAIPFTFLNPNNPNLLQDLKFSIEELGFHGAKIYPKLGYFPNDERLIPCYEYLEDKNIPIISHGSKGGIFSWNPPSLEQVKNYYQGKIPSSFKWWWKSDITKCKYCNDPRNFIPVLDKFPSLKICLAHLGGDFNSFLKGKSKIKGKVSDNWTAILLNLMDTYENLYTDTAFTFGGDLMGQELIKTSIFHTKKQDRLLLGSDWYMNCIGNGMLNDRNYVKESLSKYFKKYQIELMTEINPKKFLGV